MSALSVSLGLDARAAFCDAFDGARSSIDAEFFSISDGAIVESLNRAAARGVRVHVTLEGDTHRYRRGHAREPDDDDVRGALDPSVDVVISRKPHALVHGKAAVIDASLALVATANPTPSGLSSAGEVVVLDRNRADARAVTAEIAQAASGIDRRPRMRPLLDELFTSPSDVRVATEDLSDPRVAAWLVHRARIGKRDRVLVGKRQSRSGRVCLRRLVAAGVDVRTFERGYMHEKYVDAGARVYVGSANLTRNGIEEAHEVGIIADAADFGTAAAALRADFDSMWTSRARPLRNP